MLCLGLGLLMPLSVPASSENDAAGTEEISWVFDDYGLLDETEQAQLDQELGDIYEEYGYDAVLLISPDIGEDQDYRKYAAEFMQENDIGYGDTYEGMCVFHQPDARNITIVFRGDTQDDFPPNVQEEMLDKCKKYLKADDPVSGYQSLITDLRTGLDRICEGKKVTWMQMRKMKTRVQQANANAYTAQGGLDLSEKRDIFLYSTVSQTAKPKDNDNNNDSGSFSSGGESFSGSSSDY